MVGSFIRALALGGLIMAVATHSASARAVEANLPAALKKLERGEWQLRSRDDPAKVARKLCVSDLRQLLQVQHMYNNCKHFVVRDRPADAVVTYDCGAAGNGRTDLRVETSHLIQIQSQGIAKGAPFDFALEGRHIGACR